MQADAWEVLPGDGGAPNIWAVETIIQVQTPEEAIGPLRSRDKELLSVFRLVAIIMSNLFLRPRLGLAKGG